MTLKDVKYCVEIHIPNSRVKILQCTICRHTYSKFLSQNLQCTLNIWCFVGFSFLQSKYFLLSFHSSVYFAVPLKGYPHERNCITGIKKSVLFVTWWGGLLEFGQACTIWLYNNFRSVLKSNILGKATWNFVKLSQNFISAHLSLAA